MKLPLLRSANPARPVLWAHGRSITALEVMQKVVAVSRALPEGRNLINLCEHRDNFLVASCAALLRGHTNLLPSSRAEGVVDEVAALNPGSYRCDDEFVRAACERMSDAAKFDDSLLRVRAVGWPCGREGLHVWQHRHAAGSLEAVAQFLPQLRAERDAHA